MPSFHSLNVDQHAATSSFKLFRFGPVGREKPAVEYPDGTRLEVTAFGSDYNEAFFATNGLPRLRAWLLTHAATCPPVAPTERFGPCVARPSKIVGVGLNYHTHVQEAQVAVPAEPVLFLKATSALAGPFDAIPMPEGSTKLDWEVELAVLIGKEASLVTEAEAPNYIMGYALANDVSERTYQLEGTGEWTKGKSFDGFGPLGPYLVPADQIADPQSLALRLTVNGQERQAANTAEMVFGINHLVSYVSRYMTLLPGDILLTGTPGGVGLGYTPPVFLATGDTVELTGEGLGTQRQLVVPYLERKRALA
ncbi:fumarylacetoacetate hydrolase family protein [Hymenobacter crusticola]|uniref:Ureidoglycolate lyase n=1 Tax=Hymenobacter crusticola TaxID=1770526 RepID=A0A243W712_9BACT|nr:fumarylacetoacetate hydrolase family protein [Hymenobacter crusticola]OUJ70380.1 ureidoglycolate lyase [Hymenobacter crusticola]